MNYIQKSNNNYGNECSVLIDYDFVKIRRNKITEDEYGIYVNKNKIYGFSSLEIGRAHV